MTSSVKSCSSLVKGGEQPDRPTVKSEWNVAMHVLNISVVCQKHNSLPLGLIQPSSTRTNELHVQGLPVDLLLKYIFISVIIKLLITYK